MVDDEVMHPTPSWPLGGSPKAPYIEGHDGTVREGRSVVAGGDWDVPVQDRELSFIRVDHQTRLQFGATEVVIECPFRLSMAARSTRSTRSSGTCWARSWTSTPALYAARR